jgi:hypothetical protein
MSNENLLPSTDFPPPGRYGSVTVFETFKPTDLTTQEQTGKSGGELSRYSIPVPSTSSRVPINPPPKIPSGVRVCKINPASTRAYSDAEIEFMEAMENYKRAYQRPYPNWSEVFHVLVGLGYSRNASGSQPVEHNPTNAEEEFTTALRLHMRVQHRPFPSWTEVLGVLRTLGYQRVSNTASPETDDSTSPFSKPTP